MADVRLEEEEELRRLESGAPAVSSSEERASEGLPDSQLAGQYWSPLPAGAMPPPPPLPPPPLPPSVSVSSTSPPVLSTTASPTSSPGAAAVPAPDSELEPSQRAVKAMLAAAAKARVAGDSAPADQAWEIFPHIKRDIFNAMVNVTCACACACACAWHVHVHMHAPCVHIAAHSSTVPYN